MTFEFVLRFSDTVMRHQESLVSTVGTLRQSITKWLSKKDAHFTMYFLGIELVDDDMGLYPLLKHEYGELLRTVDVTVHDRPVAVPVAEAPDAGGGVAADGDDNSPSSSDDE